MHQRHPSAIFRNGQIVHRTALKKRKLNRWLGAEMDSFLGALFYFFSFFGAWDWGIITPFQMLIQLITIVLNMVWPCWINWAPIVILYQKNTIFMLASEKKNLEHKEICPLTMVSRNTQALHVATGQKPETSKMQLVAKIKFTVLCVLKVSFVPLPSLAMVLTNSNEHGLLRHDPQK